MKRSALGLAGLLFLLWSIPAIAAGTGISARIQGLSEDDVVRGQITVQASVTAATGIKQAQLSIDGVVVDAANPQGVKQSQSLSAVWDTSLLANGRHTIVVQATSNTGNGDRDTAGVLVDNPPAPPTNVTAASEGKSVTLTWTANTEPDLIGYRIERDGGEGFAGAGESDDASFTDQVEPGTYAYRVLALRSSPVDPEGHYSEPSEAATVTVSAAEENTGAPGSGPAGDKKGKSGLHVDPRTGQLELNGKKFAARGLPASFGDGLSLPGLSGLPDIPSGVSEAFSWGTYKEKLPYDIEGGPQEPRTLVTEASSPTSRFIPPDGLRWVAAGALLVVAAGLLRFTAVLVAPTPEPTESSAPLPS